RRRGLRRGSLPLLLRLRAPDRQIGQFARVRFGFRTAFRRLHPLQQRGALLYAFESDPRLLPARPALRYLRFELAQRLFLRTDLRLSSVVLFLAASGG